VLLDLLESVEVAYDHPNERPARFQVQWVVRPSADRDGEDYRGYSGPLASGALRRGDEVDVLPGGGRTRIAAIDTFDGALTRAEAPASISLLLEDDVDVSRGDLLADPDRPAIAARALTANVCWMTDRPLEERSRLLIKHTTRTVTARVEEIVSVVDIATLENRAVPGKMELNDLGVVKLRLAEPLAVDPYARNRSTGAFILIDEATNDTVGAGMVLEAQ